MINVFDKNSAANLIFSNHSVKQMIVDFKRQHLKNYILQYLIYNAKNKAALLNILLKILRDCFSKNLHFMRQKVKMESKPNTKFDILMQSTNLLKDLAIPKNLFETSEQENTSSNLNCLIIISQILLGEYAIIYENQ